jgi:hypothetical protein
VKRQCPPLVISSGDEKRSSTADYVKGQWHLSRLLVKRAAVEKNGWRAVSRRDSKRKQSRCVDWQQVKRRELDCPPRHDESVLCATCGRVIWGDDMQRLRAAMKSRMTREKGAGYGNADWSPSRTVCWRETRVERARQVGIDDGPALRYAGGKLRRQASALATGTTEMALFERCPVAVRE